MPDYRLYVVSDGANFYVMSGNGVQQICSSQEAADAVVSASGDGPA